MLSDSSAQSLGFKGFPRDTAETLRLRGGQFGGQFFLVASPVPLRLAYPAIALAFFPARCGISCEGVGFGRRPFSSGGVSKRAQQPSRHCSIIPALRSSPQHEDQILGTRSPGLLPQERCDNLHQSLRFV